MTSKVSIRSKCGGKEGMLKIGNLHGSPGCGCNGVGGGLGGLCGISKKVPGLLEVELKSKGDFQSSEIDDRSDIGLYEDERCI
jgi:hypothetical protein